MKFLQFGERGQERPGLLGDDNITRDISQHLPYLGGEYLNPSFLASMSKLDLSDLPLVDPSERIGCPIVGTSNFIAVGLNYADHAKESGAEIPKEPILFNKAPSCLSGPNDDVIIPPGSVSTDWEVELAIVIGKEAYNLDEVDAMSVVAGFCVCNDISERDFQLHQGGQWVKGKGCPTFGPVGPYLVTPDEIDDVQNLRIWLTVNGEPKQDSSTMNMIFPVSYLVSYISRFMRLVPGDIITTGTPPGVAMGMVAPQYLRPDDIVTLGIDGLGSQRQTFRGSM